MPIPIEYLFVTIGFFSLAVVSGVAQQKYAKFGYLTGTSTVLATCAALFVVVHLPIVPDGLRATSVDAGLGTMILGGVFRLAILFVGYSVLRHGVRWSVKKVLRLRQYRALGQTDNPIDESQDEADAVAPAPDNTTHEVDTESQSIRQKTGLSSREGVSIGPWRLDIGSDDGDTDDEYEQLT